MPPWRSSSAPTRQHYTFGGDGFRFPPGPKPVCPGHVGAIQSLDTAGAAASFELQRSHQRNCQRFGGVLPTREHCRRNLPCTRGFFVERSAGHGKENAAGPERGVTPTQYLERFGGFGRIRDLGFTAWQVAMCVNYTQEEDYMAARDTPSLFYCVLGTGCDGQWQHAGWSSTHPARRSSTNFVGKVSCHHDTSEALCTNRASKMGHDGAAVFQGDGCDHHSPQRSSGAKEFRRCGRRKPCSSISSPSSKEKTKGQGRRKREAECPEQPGRRGGGLDEADEKRFEATISFRGALAALPRWISRSRTKFSSFLDQIFPHRSNGLVPFLPYLLLDLNFSPGSMSQAQCEEVEETHPSQSYSGLCDGLELHSQ